MVQFTKEFGEIYKVVERALEVDEGARNNDKVLLFTVWEMQTGQKRFGMEDALELMKPSTIFRARRVIQNDEQRLIPTIPSVLLERRFKEAEVRKFFSGDKVTLTKYLEYVYNTEGVI